MFIVPITKIDTIADFNKTTNTINAAAGSVSFQQVFEQAINSVKQTEADADNEYMKLATGQTDDLHNLSIASQKASLSVQMLVQIRDKAMDAYNEIMRMNV